MAVKQPETSLTSSPTCPAPWLDEKRGYFVDWLTQLWVKCTGKARKREDVPWLEVPFGFPRGIGESYFDALADANGMSVIRHSRGGLVADFSNLSSASFDASKVSPEIVRFYEKTAEYDLQLWSEWCGLFRPFGWMISYTFSRRLQQLNLPIRPLDAADGITSELVQFVDDKEVTQLTAWFRTFRKTREAIYVGFYSHCAPTGKDPMVRVAFPLPNGCAVVMLKPLLGENGSLVLDSSGEGNGGSGFYFLVNRDKESIWVRYLPSFRESIQVFDEGNGELSAKHVMKLFGMRTLQMRYHMRRKI